MATLKRPLDDNYVPSSTPAFGTPAHPIPPPRPARGNSPPPAFKPAISTILPILIPPPTLRPLAFRTFTKKHNLTLNGSALQALATFIGRHCGSAWREEGTGEKVLDEVAKLWKAESGPVIVEDGAQLKGILKTLEGCMSGGRIGQVKRQGSNISRQSGFAFGNESGGESSGVGVRRPSLDSNRNSSFGMSALQVEEQDEIEEASKQPRSWIKVISSFDQPRFTYNLDKKHFVQMNNKPSFFPPPSHKTAIFRERYNVIHQRLLRNEAFQTPSFSARSSKLTRTNSTTAQQFYKLTPIANLLGRGGSSHLLLGMLVIAPTGTLAFADTSGSISLDLQHAAPLQGEDSAYFCPGMIVLVDGVYEEDYAGVGSSGLGNTGGIGGTIGGLFVGFSIGGPPVEKRNVSLGVNLGTTDVGGGFGWTDFLGLGSERAVGPRMQKLEKRLLVADSASSEDPSNKMVIFSEVCLDDPTTLSALRKVLEIYAASPTPPMAFLVMGNFTSRASMAGAGVGSIEYKELFNELAVVLSDFPSLLRNSTWIFVPGDNDPWSSAFSAGASSPIPKQGVPELFTNRVKRAFATANSEAGVRDKDTIEGQAIWTTNPARLSLFGPQHEIAIFRDDLAGRFRRSAVRVGKASNSTTTTTTSNTPEEPPQDSAHNPQPPDTEMLDPDALPTTEEIQPPGPTPETHALAQAKKLILSLLPQSTLSPFPLSLRPMHWDYATSLSLYPLPHTLVLADAGSAAFALTFEGCHVVNPGRLVAGAGSRGRRRRVQWAEYDLVGKRGRGRGEWIG
ncbi:hypothetical protein MBLNU230_g8154t1 [Neophaeotheca triangularis]